ncbi:diguanylate cyclase [Sphingomonas sp. Y38-1Y]|uniref:GGDEF domain-containing protein n=1 Tax=Sphingomonas sp. Y38-1Y TaxID=3078265 RepID=UPI0028E2E023|nr:diguanylate cyclase [Sphingomonas sp. Y38-1Y]
MAALLPAGSPAWGQAGLTGQRLAVCIAPVRSGERITDLIAGRIALDCDGRQTRYGQGDFWAATGPLSLNASEGDLRLRTASLWQARTTVGLVHANGQVDWIVADSRQLTHQLQLGAIVEYAVPAAASPITRIVWRLDGAANRRGVLNGVHVSTEKQSDRSNLYMATIYAAFGGLAIALLIFNFALWRALRHGFQLAYCLMLALLLLYALSSSGLLAWLMPTLDNNNRLRINYMTLAASAAAALLFARTYFEARVFEGGLGRMVEGVIVLMFAIGIGVALFAHRWMVELDFAFTVCCALLVAVIPLIVWRAFARRSAYIWMFALAWVAPIGTAVTRIAQSMNLVPWNFWLDNSTLIAMAVEALLSSLAIAYRIRLLSAERDKAVAASVVDRLLAATDPLTGLLNRRAFLAQAIGREGRQQLILLDIDHFKMVNETLGHDGGDEVLRVVSRVLRQMGVADTLVARLGGEEFALVAHANAPIDPVQLLARLRATRMPFDLAVTASIGACSGPLATDLDWKRLYQNADRALYDAKAGGRDRARIIEGLAAVA